MVRRSLGIVAEKPHETAYFGGRWPIRKIMMLWKQFSTSISVSNQKCAELIPTLGVSKSVFCGVVCGVF